MQKRIVGFCLFLGILIVANTLFYEFPTNVQRTYNLTTRTDDGVELVYDLYEPVGISATNPKKGIILGHGLMVNKDMMRFLAIELATEGFIVLALDFRSHGRSGGDFNQAAQSVADQFLHDRESTNNTGTLGGTFDTSFIKYDLLAMKQILINRPDVDIHNLGYLGFSMGGEAGFGVIPNDYDFQAMVGLAPSFNYDLVNQTVPKNLLLLISRFDEAISINKMYKVMEYRTGFSQSQIEVGKLYGSFADGTASKLYIDPYAEHFLGAYNYNFIRETRNWFVQALLHEPLPETKIIFPLLGVFILLEILGAIGLFAMCAELLIMKYAQKYDNPDIFAPCEEKRLGLGVIPFILFFSHFLMLFICLIFAVPLLFSDFIIMLLFGPSYAIYLYIRVLYRRNGIKRAELKTLSRKSMSRNNLLLGLVLGGILILLMQYSIGNIFGIIPNLWKCIWTPIYFICLCWCFRNYFWFFQTFLMERNLRGSASKHVVFLTGIKNILVFTLIQCFLVLLPCYLFENYFVAMILIPLELLFICASFLGAYCYSKNKDIWVAIIPIALFGAIFISNLSPIMNLWVLNY